MYLEYKEVGCLVQGTSYFVGWVGLNVFKPVRYGMGWNGFEEQPNHPTRNPTFLFSKILSELFSATIREFKWFKGNSRTDYK